MDDKPLPILPPTEEEELRNIKAAQLLEDQIEIQVPYWPKFDVALKACPPAVVSLFKQQANHAAQAIYGVAKNIPENEHFIIYNHLLQAILRCLIKAWGREPQLLAGKIRIRTSIEKRSKTHCYAIALLDGANVRGASAAYQSTWLPGRK
jgi:hypothetical protein